MTATMAHAATDEIILLLDSPDQCNVKPALRNHGLMPPGVAGMMDALWRRQVVPIRQIRFYRMREVFVVEEGLVFDRRFRLVPVSRTQHSPAQVARGQRAVRLAAASGEMPVCRGPALLACKRGGHNYGHWMIEMLPRAFLARRHLGIDGLRHVVPAIQGGIGRVILQSMTMCGVAMADIQPLAFDRPAFFEELIVVDGLSEHGIFISPRVLECIDHIQAQVPADAEALLYVSRRASATRNFAGEAEVVARMQAEGVRILDPARLSFSEQIAAFKGARGVLGAMGAGLSSIVFAPGGIPVVNFAPAVMPDTFFWMLANFRGQDYHEIRCAQTGAQRGPAAWDTDMVLAVEDLAYALDCVSPGRADLAGSASAGRG